MNVPVSIEGKYYNKNDFINRIKKANENNAPTNKFSKDSSKLLERYIERNTSSKFMRFLLFYLFDVITPQSFNGVKLWDDNFIKTLDNVHANETGSEFERQITSDKYLQSILVHKLNNFLPKSDKVKCKNYKEYIYACIQKNYVPKLDIRWSEKYGWGLYANEDIYSFMFIGLYVGQIQQLLWLKVIDVIRGFHNKYEFAFCYNEIFAINSEKNGNYTRFINHDIENKKRISTFSIQIASTSGIGIPHRGFVANAPERSGEYIIFRRGEQLLWDYGKYYKLNT